jgi:predicted aspartyl protease
MHWEVIGCLFLLLLAGCEQGAGCDLVKVAEVPLEPVGPVFVVPVTVNGHAINMVLDTGGVSFLSETTAERLGFAREGGSISMVVGVAGGSIRTDASIASMSIGGAPLSVHRMTVNSYSGARSPDGFLGLDVLGDFDLDIDGPNRRLALYRVRRCEHADPPWDQPAALIEGTTTWTGWLAVPFEIDGIAGRAAIDTGASNTVITPRLAQRLGLTEPDMASDRNLKLHVVAGADTQAHIHRFKTMRIGSITVHNSLIFVLAKNPPPLGGGRHLAEAVIGQDFLANRRIWFSMRAERLYISHEENDTPAAE